MELSLMFICLVVIMAFLCEYIDSTLGMGYGTTLTPILLLIGYRPLQIIPVVLMSELITGVMAAVFHHREGNVDLRPRTFDIPKVITSLRSLGYVESFNRGMPFHLKIALLLGVCSVAGAVIAVFVALNIPKLWLKLYIGFLVLSMGMLMIIFINKEFNFSWKKIMSLGLIASFNKGISGGGYGPLVTGGQILSGVDSKSAIGITSLAEGLTCLVGVICYIFLSDNSLDWQLAPFIIMGSVFSVPFSAKTVKKINAKRLKIIIAAFTIILGSITVIKTLWSN